VLHFGKGLQGTATDPLRRRVGTDQLGMGLLQLLQLTEQPVVFGIRNTRLIEHVVAVVVCIQFMAQGADALGGVSHGK